MKTIKASLLLPLLTMLFSIALSGCYTQLAFVNDEQDSAVEPSPTIIYIHEPVVDYVPVPYDPPPPPVFILLPTAGSTSTVTAPQPTSPSRDFGYQRSDQSVNTQAINSGSDTRTSGSTRGGR